MNTPQFDFAALFDADYLYFYEPLITAERSDRDVDLIWRLLGLQPEMTVLDLACGHGRIANRLAKRGCHVTGLDASAFFLDLARREAAEWGVEVEYIQGDMRSLPWIERFDCIIIWLTAFGYFEDEDNRRILTEANRALKAGGKLILDSFNRDLMLKQFRPEMVTERDGNYAIDRHRYDILTGRSYSEKIIIKDGKMRRMEYFVRYFTYTEIRDWCLQAGFSQVEGYGDNGEPLTIDSQRMDVIAKK